MVDISKSKTSETPIYVHFVAQYPLFSDTEAREWFEYVETGAHFESLKLLTVLVGRFGLQHIFFEGMCYVGSNSPKNVRKAVRKALNRAVGDTDVILHRCDPEN